MHIPDLVLDPTVAAVTSVVGLGGLLYCLRKTTQELGERTTVLMGSISAFVFAAQMVNFPVGLVVSGHLLGGVLASVLLGPWAGAVVIAAVLLVQCFLFADGGVTALGANFINMGLVGAVGGYAIYTPLRRMIGGQKGVLIAAMAAAWFSVILASGAFAIELGASGHWVDFVHVLSWMVLVHAAIGLGEAVITGLVVRFILVRRPDLFEVQDGASSSAPKRWGQIGLAGLGVALAVAIFLSPFAYDQPDGLEFVGEKLHFLPVQMTPLRLVPSPHRSLTTNSVCRAWNTSSWRRPRLDWWVPSRSLASPGGWQRSCRAAGPKRSLPMRFEGLERHSVGTGVLHRLDARIKLVAALSFILIVLATPFGAGRCWESRGYWLRLSSDWQAFPHASWLVRWLAFFVLVGFLTLMVAPANPARARHGLWVVAATILIKNSLAVLTMLILAGTTPFHRLLVAVRKLGMPAVLVATLQFMDRYRHVLVNELDSMATARGLRTFNRRDSLAWSC